MRSKLFISFSFLFVVLVAPVAARAGGPLFIDPATLTPIRYAPGPTKVYTDLGTLGPLSNSKANERVAFAFKQWTDVPTSSFEAQVAGDFTTLGLPDINGSNAGDVIGVFNGGGIDVIYDSDGTVISDFFGAPPFVLGIASPEFGKEGTNEITESWAVMNGYAIDPADANGETFTGVMTHEFGHSINLGHTQVNGAIMFFGDAPGPNGCDELPYAGTPTREDIETMYPFIDPTAGTGSGQAQSTVDIADDMISISNIYPEAGWPQNFGSVSGVVTTTDGKSQLAGVNVIARNVADPYRDASSMMTGDVLRGEPGNEGTYTLNGLKPGESYVIYIDGIVAGGYSTPPAVIFPGPEEFFNGSAESGDATTDESCSSEAIAAAAGVTTTANIAFNALPGAPVINVIGRDLVPFDITSDGKTIVGDSFEYLTAPAFKFTEKGGVEFLGGAGSTASIAQNGTAIASNTLQDDGYQVASLWQGGTSWLALPGLEGSCDGAEPLTKSVAFGVSNGGKSVVGLGFVGGGHCEFARAFKWDAATNTTTVLETPESDIQSRANGISGDGRVVWGFKVGETGFREAAIWTNGKLNALSTDAYPVGEAFNASPNGKWVVGTSAGPNAYAWRWSAKTGVQEIGGVPGYFYTDAFAVNASGNVITGRSNSFFDPQVPFIWTPALGLMNLQDFLRTQGTFIDPSVILYSPNSMSASGTRLAGVGGGSQGNFGWYIDINTVKVCHTGPGGNPHTVDVAFPDGLDKHLAHGDTLGACEKLKW